MHLRSRNDNDFSVRYPAVVSGLAKLPNDTVIDGELIALADDGLPSFSALENYGATSTPILYFVFDVMVLEGDVKTETLDSRRELLERKSFRSSLSWCATPARWTLAFETSFIRSRPKDWRGWSQSAATVETSPAWRSGAWMKMRVNQGQEFVIGGYTVGTKTFDALIFGYYECCVVELYNGHRAHAGLARRTPDPRLGPGCARATGSLYRGQVRCRGLYQTPIAA